MCSQVVGMLFWLLFTLLACFLVALKVWQISLANSVVKSVKQREDKKHASYLFQPNIISNSATNYCNKEKEK